MESLTMAGTRKYRVLSMSVLSNYKQMRVVCFAFVKLPIAQNFTHAELVTIDHSR